MRERMLAYDIRFCSDFSTKDEPKISGEFGRGFAWDKLAKCSCDIFYIVL